MKPIRPALALSLMLCAAVHSVSYGMDGPEDDAARPPAPKPEDKPAEGGAAAEAASDEKARAILAEAGAWQNAGDLGQEGKLTGFHVLFGAAQFEREKTNDKGETSTTIVDTDDDGLVVDWMQSGDKKDSFLKTQIAVHGNVTTKAYLPTGTPWIFDGKKVSPLTGADRKTDYDELMFHKRVVDQLLDVAFLDKLKRDKSRWKLLDDASHPGTVAIQRVPTQEALEIVRITLWIADQGGGKYGNVAFAEMPPAERGGPSLLYEFIYDSEHPAVRRKMSDGTVDKFAMSFPWMVKVYEQRAGSAERRQVLQVQTKDVDLNTVVDTDFLSPQIKK